MSRVLTFCLCILSLILSWAAANASPPSSCACKFVGTWTYSGGTTTVNPDGTATPHCPACVAVQSWTCSGNTYYFSNSGAPGQFSAVLLDDTHLQGGGVLATRTSRGTCGASTAKKPSEAPREQQQQSAASNTCIVIGRARPWGRSYEENGWQTNYIIDVDPSKKPGCPKNPYIKYTEPNGKEGEKVAIPFRIQTPGAPATNIHVVP